MNEIPRNMPLEHYKLETGKLEKIKEQFIGTIENLFKEMKESQKSCGEISELEKKIVFLETENRKLLKIIELAKIKITSGEENLRNFEKKLEIKPGKKVLNRENSLISLSVRWKNALKLFEESYPKAFAFLNFCSFFNPKSIVKKWTFDWLIMEKIGRNKDVDPLLKILKKFDIVEYNYFSSTFSLRKYMQKIVQKNMSNKEEIYRKAFHFLALKIDGKNYYEISNWCEMRRCCSHLKFMLKNDCFKTVELKKIGKDLITAYSVMEFFKMGNFENEKALKYCKKAYEIIKKLYGNEPHKEKFFHLYRIGKYYYEIGKRESALERFLEALKMSKKIYGETANEDVCSCLNYIGYCYGDLGKNEEKLKYCEQALEMRKKLELMKRKNKAKVPPSIKESNGIVRKFFLREFKDPFTKFY